MNSNRRKSKNARPTEDSEIEWPRADPAALAAFDPETKTCTMNCGPHALDPRSRKERKLLCDDCVPYCPSVHEQLHECQRREAELRAELAALRAGTRTS